MYKYELRGNIKAHQLGMDDLEIALDKPYSYLDAAVADNAVTRCTEAKKLMKDNILVLTNLSGVNIDEMEKAIANFNDSKGSNKVAVKNKKATGTDVITPLLDEADVPKGQIEKIFVSYLPDLANGWMLQTKVGKAGGIKHLKMRIKFVDFDTNVVLNKVKTTLTNAEGKKSIKFSTKKGFTSYKGLENGNYSEVSELAGYTADSIMNIGISDDEIKKYVVKMKKI